MLVTPSDTPPSSPNQPGALPSISRRGLTRIALISVAALFILGHGGEVAREPDSIDATNFVLGVRDFDVARHQPHPPGYPVYIALGRAARAFVPLSTGPGDGSSREARALSALGIALGGLAVVPLALYRPPAVSCGLKPNARGCRPRPAGAPMPVSSRCG